MNLEEFISALSEIKECGYTPFLTDDKEIRFRLPSGKVYHPIQAVAAAKTGNSYRLKYCIQPASSDINLDVILSSNICVAVDYRTTAIYSRDCQQLRQIFLVVLELQE